MGAKFNFTVSPVGFEGFLSCTDSVIADAILVRSEKSIYGGLSTVYLLRGFDYDMLMHGNDVDSVNAVTMESILRPFPLPVWILLVLAICVATVFVLVATKSSDVAGYAVGIISPLLGQVTLRIQSESKARETFGTASGCYAAWILMTVYISSIYLGMLQSLKISPQIQTVNTSFHQIIEAGFAFYFYPHIVRAYNENYLGESVEIFRGMLSKNDFDDHALLASLLEPMALENVTLKFLELEQVVWLETQDYIAAIRELLTPALERSYHILKRRFNSYPRWTVAMVRHGHEVMGEYQRLIDSGVTGHWVREGELLRRERFKLVLRQQVDFSWTDAVQTGFLPEILRDSLVLESLFLYGLGITVSAVAKFVEIALDALEFV